MKIFSDCTRCFTSSIVNFTILCLSAAADMSLAQMNMKPRSYENIKQHNLKIFAFQLRVHLFTLKTKIRTGTRVIYIHYTMHRNFPTICITTGCTAINFIMLSRYFLVYPLSGNYLVKIRLSEPLL
jgi:hypothetical protein